MLLYVFVMKNFFLRSIAIIPSLLYCWTILLRNLFFDKGYFKEQHFSQQIISVGNLSVGGTGKTPFIMYLIELFKDQYKIATLSRGYGRKTKGVKIAQQYDSAESIGDEPFLFYQRYHDTITVAVAEKRVKGVEKLNESIKPEIILLDDAYQHRAIARDINILLTDYSSPFYKDYVLPHGRLRESRNNAKRADIVVVTKCPKTLHNDEQQDIERNIHQYNLAPVFFTYITYQKLICVHRQVNKIQKVISFSGIAKATDFEDYLAQKFELIANIRFKDHQNFGDQEIQNIITLWEKVAHKNTVLVTTEKDWARLKGKEHLLKDIPLYYLPISIDFVNQKNDFLEYITTKNSFKS